MGPFLTIALAMGTSTVVRGAWTPTTRSGPSQHAVINDASMLEADAAAAGVPAAQIEGNGPWHWQPHDALPPWQPLEGQQRLGGGDHCRGIQYHFRRGTNGPGTEAASRAAAIKQEYLDAWNEYVTYSSWNDTLLPVTHTGLDDFYSWSLTVVDGLDTAITMGLKDVVDAQLSHIATIDFSRSAQLVDGFDTIIRYIGGLLSAYDLITSGLVPHAHSYNETHVTALLTAATTLADLLTPQFDTPSGLPRFFINTTTHVPSDGPFPFTDPLTNETYTSVTNTAIAGTIILEYHRLSDLTGDESYRRMADRAEANLVHPKPTPIFPGLVGSMLNIQTGEFFNYDTGWKSEVDSFFEYLIKSYIYNPSAPTAQQYKDFWITAVESTAKHLALHPYGHPELTFITELNASGAPLWRMDDYACFAGGNLLLGGASLGRRDFVDLGLAVTDSCHTTYNTTASGLNPLAFAWYGPDNTAYDPQYNDNSSTGRQARTFFEQHGYFPVDVLHTLFPEPVESIMHAYRITGNPIWQEYNWEIFRATQKAGKRKGAVMSSPQNVTQPFGGEPLDYLPSYYFAETLKYLYLTFSDPGLVSLDDFVFNTECHPLRIQGGTCSAREKRGALETFGE